MKLGVHMEDLGVDRRIKAIINVSSENGGSMILRSLVN